MKKRYSIGICLLLLSVSPFVIAQKQQGSKFQFHADYHYFFGLKQRVGDYYTLTRHEEKMYANSFRFSGMYSFTPRFAAGIGVGADCYENPSITTFPLFASFRYSPLHKTLSPYAFTNIGYSFKTPISDRGFLLDLGLGYKYMFKEHFGIKFEIGYNLKQIRVDKEDVIIIPDKNGYAPEAHALSVFRHSLFVGTGFVF